MSSLKVWIACWYQRAGIVFSFVASAILIVWYNRLVCVFPLWKKWENLRNRRLVLSFIWARMPWSQDHRWPCTWDPRTNACARIISWGWFRSWHTCSARRCRSYAQLAISICSTSLRILPRRRGYFRDWGWWAMWQCKLKDLDEQFE